MNTKRLFDTDHGNKAVMVFVICLAIMVASVVLSSLIQTDVGRVEVTNVRYENFQRDPCSG